MVCHQEREVEEEASQMLDEVVVGVVVIEVEVGPWAVVLGDQRETPIGAEVAGP